MAHIAIADNSTLTLATLRALLEQRGHEIQVAESIEAAEALAQTTHPDLWLIDVRLRDNTDDKDVSGLTFAKRINGHAPKIMLTDYPTWRAVRDALGTSLNGAAPAVAFLSKKEGFDALLARINLALAPRDESLLREFGASEMSRLPERIEELGSEQAGEKLRSFIDQQRGVWRQRQDLEIRRASDYHRASLAASGAGFLVILAGIAFSLMGSVPTATVATCGGLLVNVVSALFCLNADKAHQRLKESLPQSERLLELANLLELCNTFETSEVRERNRQLVFDKFLQLVGDAYGAGDGKHGA